MYGDSNKNLGMKGLSIKAFFTMKQDIITYWKPGHKSSSQEIATDSSTVGLEHSLKEIIQIIVVIVNSGIHK